MLKPTGIVVNGLQFVIFVTASGSCKSFSRPVSNVTGGQSIRLSIEIAVRHTVRHVKKRSFSVTQLTKKGLYCFMQRMTLQS